MTMTPLEQHIFLLSGLASRGAQPADLAWLMVGRREPGQRAMVYRNSGMSACTDALKSNYQRVARVVGDSFFRGLAHAFIDQHPPIEHSLVGYGHDLPEFIDASAKEHGIPWLGDFARLDRAWLKAHLAADGTPIAPSGLQSLSDETLLSAQIVFHPSLALVSTHWDLWELWIEASDEAFTSTPRTLIHEPSWVLFWRPEHEVVARPLPDPFAIFLSVLQNNETLGAASAQALARAPGEDLPALIAAVFSAGLVTDINLTSGDSQ
ncbi:MAG TPA: DNA-binding domain-containing protein [Hyphomonas sp.]|nr:DNA-binding domain-containing protein [Hyphomonas sp.]